VTACCATFEKGSYSEPKHLYTVLREEISTT
jgi:hypothetical protein